MSARIVRNTAIVMTCVLVAAILGFVAVRWLGTSGGSGASPMQAETPTPVPTPTPPEPTEVPTKQTPTVRVATIDATGADPVWSVSDGVLTQFLDEHSVRFVADLSDHLSVRSPDTDKSSGENQAEPTGNTLILEYQIESPVGSVADGLDDGSVAIHIDNKLLFGAAAPSKAFNEVQIAGGSGKSIDVSPRKSAVSKPWEIADNADVGKNSVVFHVRQKVTITSQNRIVASLWGSRMVESTRWRETGDTQESLAVFPTQFARQVPQIALRFAHGELVQHEPKAESSVMDKQLTCHIYGATTKPSWNLEPWRPDSPLIDYLFHRCNPPIE